VKRELAGGYELDDDGERIDVDAVHDFIANHSYWAPGRSRELQDELVRQAIRVVGLYEGDRQIGFARATGDSHFVYLADVYVLPEYRGRGLGVELVREIVENGPYAASLWFLHTADAHKLYEKFGFGPPSDRVMERPRRT
jgi:GNAT superfamily N-acetyltransferase